MEHKHCNPRKNQIIIGVFIVGCIMLGIILFVGNNPQTSTALNAFLQTENFTASGKSLEEIRQAGVSQYCTFQDGQGRNVSNGQFGTFQGNVYMSVISGHGDLVTFFIFDQQKVHAWNSVSNNGFVYTPQDSVLEFGDVRVDMNSVRSAICTDKDIDARQFLLPPGVAFSQS